MLFAASLFLFSCRGEVDETPAPVQKISPQNVPYYSTPDFTAEWLTGDVLPANFHRIAGFSFEDQNGITINSASVKGKPYIAGFFFTSCRGICPVLTTNLQFMKQSIDSSLHIPILLHSVMPETDTREVLHRYAANYDLGSDWHLLTGNKDSIYTLARKSYFADEDMGEKTTKDDFLHTENILLIDGTGHIRGIYKGTSKLEMQALADDARKLL